MDGEVTQVGTRMAPAAARGAAGSMRRTFAVGKLTWQRSELRVVETRRLERRDARRLAQRAAETVH
jgi:hypothetical protein